MGAIEDKQRIAELESWQKAAVKTMDELERQLSEANENCLKHARKAEECDEYLERAEAAEATEREECAKLCCQIAETNEVRGNMFKMSPDEPQTRVGEMHIQGATIARDCAVAIRKRGNP